MAQKEGYTPFPVTLQTHTLTVFHQFLQRTDMTSTPLSLVNFDSPDEVREFPNGKFELVRVAGMTLGRATCQPGWKWSQDVGPSVGAASCAVEHLGFVVSGCAVAAMNDGRLIEMKAGDVFSIPAGHDSWVVGDLPYVSIHLMGAEAYAQHGNT